MFEQIWQNQFIILLKLKFFIVRIRKEKKIFWYIKKKHDFIELLRHIMFLCNNPNNGCYNQRVVRVHTNPLNNGSKATSLSWGGVRRHVSGGAVGSHVHRSFGCLQRDTCLRVFPPCRPHLGAGPLSPPPNVTQR